MSEIVVARDLAELNCLAAERFVNIAEESIEKRSRFTVALSGGSTPKALYRLLASEPFRSQVDWENVLFFFGDERNVPPDSSESNFRMANESLFEPLKISSDNIFRWKTELGDSATVADDYENRIRSTFSDEFPEFDLILLGMGLDGHTASLFPDTPALDETKQITFANPVVKLDTTRLTLTFLVINAALNVFFIVAGEEKADTLAKVLESDSDPHKLPARMVDPTSGRLIWYVDSAAATHLSR